MYKAIRLFVYLSLPMLWLFFSQVIYPSFAISQAIYLPIYYFSGMLTLVVVFQTFGIGWHIVRDPFIHQRYLYKKLVLSNQKIRSILDASRDGILLISKEGEILETNLAGKTDLGYEMEELMGESVQKLFPEDDQAQWNTVLQAIRTGEKNSFCGRVLHHCGNSVPVELNIQPLILDGIEYAVILVCDLTEHHNSMEIAKGVFEDATEGIIITDFEGNITTVNQAFTRITGYTSEEVIGRNPRILKSDRHDAAYYREMWTSLQTKRYWQGEIWNRHKDGAIYPELLTITSIRNLSNKLTNYLGIFLDRTEYRELEKTINQLAHYDTLTGLPNQSLFLERLNISIEQKTQYGGGLAVCVINLKNFKEINSLIGHNQADELLKEVARRIRSIIQNDDVIARINGGEFGLFHFAETGAVHEITLLAQKLLEQIQLPWQTGELELKVSANIGIAVYPLDGSDGEELLRNAGLAWEQKGEHSHLSYNFFTPSINEKIARRFTMEQNLRVALEREEFVLYYQPQIDLLTKEVVGFEALVRWQHPEHGLVPPGDFIPVAEETDLILPLGAWVIRTACKHAVAWQETGFSPVRVAINLSAKQFNQPSLVSDITQILLETGLAPQWLELEITESVAMENVQFTMGVLQELQDMGINISLDDFGTGYSSLIYLKRFPNHTLKIDQDFVREVPDNPEDAAIVVAIITLAKHLKLQVIAEGVETLKQLQFLESNGCDGVQGYFYSPPVKEENVSWMLKNQAGFSFKAS